MYAPNPGHLDKRMNDDRRMRNVCERERPTDQGNKLCVEVNKDSNDPKDNFYRDKHDDNLLEAFRVSTRN